MLFGDSDILRTSYSRADLLCSSEIKFGESAPHHIDILIRMSHSNMQTLVSHLLDSSSVKKMVREGAAVALDWAQAVLSCSPLFPPSLSFPLLFFHLLSFGQDETVGREKQACM